MTRNARAPIEAHVTVPAGETRRFGQRVRESRWLTLAEAVGDPSLQGYVGIREQSTLRRFPRVPDPGSNPPVDYDDPTSNAVSSNPEAEPIVFAANVVDARYVLAAEAPPNSIVEMYVRNTDQNNAHDARIRIGTGTSLAAAIGGDIDGG